MGCLKIYQDSCADVTIVSNRFIDEFMPQANDAQLKIYLYLLRSVNASMQSAERSLDISGIADTFNHTEKDVMRALKYWEKCGVLLLESDAAGNLTGIRLVDLSEKQAAPAKSVPDQKKTSAQESGPYSKPSYSLDDLKAFQQKDSTAQLLFIAEQYLGRTLSPSDIKSILFFSDRLHFSDDLIDYLLQYCVERGKKDFRYMEKVAISWAEAGVSTPAEAERQAGKYDKTVYTIMNSLGKTNAPTRREAEFIRRWREEYGFEPSIIMEACERTVLATDRHRFEYADKILSSWKESGVHHLSDITRLDEGFQKEKPVRQARERSADRYNRFMQNSYDYDALEKELLHS
ncbi:MAG TPA: DnaD domain protein [Candidatus Eisenbergiella merdipullorum]|uniref:DnaD domain protein n=1 Tax=Candidatus Eisenbergiella merdipullorum TaxID=2838553 RepID=A0A9D2I6C3_9FIRM|nr:DnaD domain protein [Candidatus Eisenbergiella merdipullorum]